MECFGIKTVFLFTVLCLSQGRVDGQQTDLSAMRFDMTLPQIKAMLQSSMEQNRKLEQQNDRLRMIWKGMESMCTAIAQEKCSCPQTTVVVPNAQLKQNIVQSTVAQQQQQQQQQQTQSQQRQTQSPSTTTPMPPPSLKVVSIDSEGLSNGSVTIHITYTAPDDHTTDWIKLYKSGATTRTSGRRIKNAPFTFTSTTRFPNFNETRYALFRLYSNERSASLKLNLTEVSKKGKQVLPYIETDQLDLNDFYTAPARGDLNITVNIKDDPRDGLIIRDSELFFTGLNTTSSPPRVFEIIDFNSDGLGLTGNKRGNNTTTFIITLREPYVQYGGILTFRLPKDVGGYVEDYFAGNLVNILNPKSQELIPFGNLGIYTLPKRTLISEPAKSILCAAMGNPRPEVFILKTAPDGKLTETNAETIVVDTVTNMKAITLHANDIKNSEGTYTCRAVSVNQTIDSVTEAVVFKPAVFDEVLTGVTENSTNKIVISCKAYGRPRPKLEMRLYEEFGPDIAASGLFKIFRSTPNDMTAQLTLTLSPTDLHVHTVFCVANQSSYKAERMITVFPKAENHTNWYFYNRVAELNRTT